MESKTHIPKEAKMDVIKLPSKQMSQKTIDYFKKCRNHNLHNEILWNVFEEGRGDIIVILMTTPAILEADEKFINMPNELKQLLYFMADREIDIIYCDTDDVWADEKLKEINPKEYFSYFIIDERMPVYDDDGNPLSHNDVLTILMET